MDQGEIEAIIVDRINELRALEQSEHLHRLRIPFQDKRDELENLLLRIHAMNLARNGAA